MTDEYTCCVCVDEKDTAETDTPIRNWQEWAEDNTVTEDTGLQIYTAWADAGEPVCVGSYSDGGLSANVYLDDEGDIRGVSVYTNEGVLLTAAGQFPFEAVQQDREYRDLPPLADPWVDASAFGA